MAALPSDLAEVSARFGTALRQAGLPVGPGRSERFAAAVTVAKPTTRQALYLCALATLVSSKDHALILKAVFDQVFGNLGDGAESRSPSTGPEPTGLTGPPAKSSDDLLARAAKAAQRHASSIKEDQPERSGEADQEDSAEPDREVADRYLGTSAERLANKDFADLSDDELITVISLMRRLTLAVPERISRRQRRRPGGRRTDMRATLR
ncbi:MAG TPA: hypothetical protein VFI65_23090, partial [Streptosporangiaceae bacterium]|nr:hypothetical protein [Streptosporangiaceae bacterium]